MVSEWKLATLDEIASASQHAFVDGPFGSNLPASCYTNSGVPVIRGSNLSLGTTRFRDDEFVYVSSDTADRLQRSCCKPLDIIFTKKGTLGQTGLVPENLKHQRYLLSGNQMKLTVDRSKADPLFVFYFVSSRLSREKIVRDSEVTGVPKTNLSYLKKFPIPLPPLSEQRAIAAVLGALDDKIELNRRMNATLEAMARALFQSWFVDFDPVRAKLDGRRPTGLDEATAALFPKHFEESSIGKKPFGWQVTTLGKTLSVLETGGRPKGGVGGITSGIPSIGAESIVAIGHFDFGKTKLVPFEFFESMKKGHIASHDVLLYKDGGRPGEYEPHVSMFGDGFPFKKCSINEHVYRLRAKDLLSQEYLYFWLTSELAFAEMRIKGTGVAIPGLNSTAVRSLTVLVPPPTVVYAFTHRTAPLITHLLANAKQCRTLAILRDTLLPKLLSGDLEVQKINLTPDASP